MANALLCDNRATQFLPAIPKLRRSISKLRSTF